AYRSAVGPHFFATVGARSLQGRDFNEEDRAGAPKVAIVNAPLANYLWPSKSALGECMWLDEDPDCYRIVGGLDGVWKFSALKREKMAVYLPLNQTIDAVPGAIFIRPRNGSPSLLSEIRALAQSAHPGLPAVRAILLRDLVDPEIKPWRLGATI